MAEQRRVADFEERRRALDPERSFIVQAPAGSGKTELLIQRYLVLLARVDVPEEVAAITFTNKAAGEMRKRVLDALNAARTGAKPKSEHEERTLALAKEAVKRDAQQNWQIEKHPARLCIQTIDSLCLSLTRQMPVLSGFGSQPEIVEDARELCLAATRATLALLESEESAARDVERLLDHLDNNMAVAEELLAAMLARRDQWLRHLHGANEREALEAALSNARLEALAQACVVFPANETAELLGLARFAASNLEEQDRESPTLACRNLAALPGAAEAGVSAWLGLAHLLLTSAGEWRKRWTVAEGFPPTSGANKKALQDAKDRIEALAARFAANQALRKALHELRLMPPAGYSEAQWEALGAIARLLPRAVAELKVVFAARGQADFSEISQAALRALGSEDEPTELALALDYRIRYLLVDEFQDTSVSQFELLKMLTAGWEAGDGRTLFAVGDPMQSIYGFREAEVGLFLKARRENIGSVALEPLTLSVNFRSQQGIVDWVNRTFEEIMPAAEEVATGAVPYSASSAHHPRAAGGAVTIHPFLDSDKAAEAKRIVELVQTARAENPEGTIAILVRNRAHLREIVPALKEARFKFRAIEIEELGHRPVVQDLLALTRALSHLADRLAWLAILRAPWCGLKLADLEAVAGGDRESTLWELMHDETRLARLSTDGQARLARMREVLAALIISRRRSPLRDRVEAAWLALGGPACVEDPTDLEDALVYLDFLEATEEAGEIADLAALEEGVAKLYALPDVRADERLQIMTIHKAKGLEFDTVIVPGLGEAPRKRDKSLVLWVERPLRQAQDRLGGHYQTDLLLASVKESGAGDDPVYSYLVRLSEEKQSHEEARLLYVAATRAKQRLHLLGHSRAEYRDGRWELNTPQARSLLAKLWPAVEPEFRRTAEASISSSLSPSRERPVLSAAEGVGERGIRRLESGWALPAPPSTLKWQEPGEPAHRPEEEIEFSWAGETARHAGTVAHHWLQRIGEDELKGWDRERVEKLRPEFSKELSRLGMPTGEIAAASVRVVTALSQILEDERGRWLLGPHPEAQRESRLTGILGGEIVNIAIDRTFVDENGTRWIVDYKTGTHAGGDLEGFLDREQERYRAQLERYAALVRLFDNRPVKLGLYFPLLKGWREW